MMIDSLLLPLILVVLLVLCVALGYLLLQTRRNAQQGPQQAVLEERLQARALENQQLQEQLAEARSALNAAQTRIATLSEQAGRQDMLQQQERKHFEEKLQLLQDAREQMTLQFKQLAAEILEQKSRTFTDANRDNLASILQPLSEKIQQFEKRVEETYDRESKQRFSLQHEIRNLQELNQRISDEAVNLTRALKGESKTQGIWGEVILERVLERSGLSKGSEYEVQVNLKDEEGRSRQPDVIIHLPEGKDIIIDAKVSLNAYERFSSCSDEAEAQEYLRQHIQAIRQHLKSLSDKNYQDLLKAGNLDFVMMFLPVEAAFTLAVQHDNTLFSDAFDKNIVLVGPSTLLATLRTIHNIWRYEHQNKNAQEIARRAGRLYDKFVAFAVDLDAVSQRLDQTQRAFEQARNKLSAGRGNVVNQVEQLKKLGAKANKQLPGSWLDQSRLDDDSDVEDDESDDEQA